MSTMLAKARYQLAMSDLERIQGYRRQCARLTLMMYYVNDLKDAAIAKHSQHHFDNCVPAGKELSGVAVRERAKKEEQECVAVQADRDRKP